MSNWKVVFHECPRQVFHIEAETTDAAHEIAIRAARSMGFELKLTGATITRELRDA